MDNQQGPAVQTGMLLNVRGQSVWEGSLGEDCYCSIAEFCLTL